jgi:hypothetical protein
MENYLSPKTEKIIEVFAIILTCVFMFGVILTPVMISYYYFHFDTYYIGFLVSAIITTEISVGIKIYGKKIEKKGKIPFREYLNQLKPNIITDIFVILSSSILLMIICAVITFILALFDINHFTNGFLNGIILALVLIGINKLYKKEIKGKSLLV